MAAVQTSGSYSYSASVVTLLSAALRCAQVIAENETPTGDQLQSGLDAMSAMIKGWMATGIHVWTEEECILFPQANQCLYQLGPVSTDHAALYNDVAQTDLDLNAAASDTTITVASATGIANGDNICVQLDSGLNFWTTVDGAPSGQVITLTDALPSSAAADQLVFAYTTALMRPLKVYGGRRFTLSSLPSARIDVPMNMWARLDYQNQPNKYSSGTITAFFYDPQTNGSAGGVYAAGQATGILNLWPNPSSNQFAFRFTAQRPIQDIANLSNLPDFPVEWNAAIKWNLALELAGEYGVPSDQSQVIMALAQKWYGIVQSWDRENESVLFGPAFQPGYRRG